MVLINRKEELQQFREKFVCDWILDIDNVRRDEVVQQLRLLIIQTNDEKLRNLCQWWFPFNGTWKRLSMVVLTDDREKVGVKEMKEKRLRGMRKRKGWSKRDEREMVERNEGGEKGAIAGTSPFRLKIEVHRTVKTEGVRAVKIQEKGAIQSVQAPESRKATPSRFPMVTTRNMDNNNSRDMIRELQAQLEMQAKLMEEQAQTIRQQRELQQK
ncbi:hypothetical protein V8G54_029018 [Vigna mungo]|uniref:Uncharacterized protein n=1 Tax=Vigna mungo TaxID=3915 RepID=A0AAQ3RL17_VIGMU